MSPTERNTEANSKETRFSTGWQTASRIVDDAYVRSIEKDIDRRHGKEGKERRKKVSTSS